MLHRTLYPALLLVLLAAAPVRAQGALDHIPPDALGALVVPNLTELVKKGDVLIKEGGLDPRLRPSQLVALVYFVLGILPSDVDEEKPIVVTVVNPKVVDPDGGLTDKCLVAVIPFKDLDGLAGKFGFGKGELKSGKVTPVKRANGFLGNINQCYVDGKRFFIGGHEKAILNVAKTKGLGGELTAAQRKLLGKSDMMLHLGTAAWGDLWKDLLRGVESQFDVAASEEEKQSAKEFLEALRGVRFGLAGLRVDKGIGLSILSVFPKEGNDAAKKFLTTFGAGEGASSLRGLPEGNVIAAQAARGDGTRNARIARLFFRVLVQKVLETNSVFGTGDRGGLLAVFSEVWQRLQGSRLGLYRTKDAGELGLFSVVGILDTDDPKKFLDELRQLAKLGSADGIDLKTEAGKKSSEAEIEQLIRELGHRRFAVRESAAAKLALAGEPVLPYLEKALKSSDIEVSRSAGRIKRDIVQAAEERRKELLSGSLTVSLKPSFAFLDKLEQHEGTDVQLVAVKLSKRDAASAPALKSLLGPDWNRVRMAVHGKQVVVLVGSDVGLFRSAIKNLKEERPGLAAAKVLAGQVWQTDPTRKVELHVSAQMAAALATATDLETPAKVPANGPLSSVTLTVAADRVQVDLWVPAAEAKVISKLLGW